MGTRGQRAGTERAEAVHGVPTEMRTEVRLLGDALGRVLTESGGPSLLDDVERLRHAVIAGRTGAPGAGHPADVVASFDLDRALAVARAFTVYFQLANLAEERQRVRALRARRAAPRADSFASVAAGLGDGLDGALGGLEVRPVLTAHPTEARRRAVVSAVRRIGEVLDRPGADQQRRLLEEVTVLWRTAQLRRTRPGPLDEVRSAMAVFDESLFGLVPLAYRAFEQAASGPDAGARPPRVPAYLRFGSWIGGDRDGNPNVTSAVTRETLDIQADHVLRALANATTRVGRSLTLAADQTPPSREVRAALQRAADAWPRTSAELAVTSPDEPHRQLLLFAAARLEATRRRDADLAYGGADELLADLRAVQRSLAAAGAGRVAYGALQDLVWQTETFGFHLADLEVRQHSTVHAAALRDLGADPTDPAALDALARGAAEADDASAAAATREVLATLRAMAAVQRRWGPAACRRYVVSFTSGPADLAAVHALARLAIGEAPLALDVVPLFETRDDLARAVEVLDAYVELPVAAEALRARGGRIEVMVGYSDSAKDVGPVGAAFALYEAQARLVSWARGRGLTLTLFHGRGGAAGRGGGPAGRAVLSSPPGAVDGRFKVTEQGEVIFARYGSPAIGVRHLEQVTTAVLRASTDEVERRAAQAAERFGDLASVMGDAAVRAYRELVGIEGFAAFVRAVSPLEELNLLHIGSRPARRGGGADLASLRAIPWVFAWAQTRCNLPGWYGLGTGLAAAAELPGGVERLREAYRDWPLFASLLDNAEMSLAKADRAIAERYLALADRPDVAARILDELDRSIALLLRVLDQPQLLDAHPVLARAVDLRNPYVDALSHLQLGALGWLRADPEGPAAERSRELLLLTINGVAAGLQNTG